MTATRCPPAEVLARATTADADEALRAHVQSCPPCRSAVREAEEIIALGRELPTAALDGERVDAVRIGLLAAAAHRRGQAPGRRGGGLALAAAAVVLLGLGVGVRLLTAPGVERAQRGTVRPLGHASYVHSGPARDEIVRLAEGTLVIEVQPLSRGERFRVLTRDGEVAVHGTMFEVTAHADLLASVRVLHGTVEVRPPQGGPLYLHAGQRWTRQAADAVAPVVSAGGSPPSSVTPVAAAPVAPVAAAPIVHRQSAVAPAVPSAPPVAPPAAPPSSQAARAAQRARLDGPPPDLMSQGDTTTPAERALQSGMTALRAGRHAAAAVAFRASMEAAGDQPLAEDASFWRGVALARAGEAAEATRAMRAFLRRYSTSARAGEASSILGWLLFDARELDEAERHFQSAARAPAPAIQQGAREGLRAIAALRQAAKQSK